ncbi:MAG: tetratricopeptide repeat protein [Verrucomicrobiota bacterium]
MSRFVNLELGGTEDGDHLISGTVAVKDEVHYAGEARKAYENGNFEQGLRNYSKVLEFNPSNVSAWAGQVRMLIEVGEFREAKLWADKALERFPNEPELLAAKAVALGRSGDLDTALAFSDASIEERGDTPYIWLARGDVLLARQEGRADYCFEKAIMLSPRDWFVAWLAGRLRSYHKQFAQALKFLQKALELNATHFLLWVEIGICQERLGLLQPAAQSYAQARELDPGNREATMGVSRISNTSVWGKCCSKIKILFQ